MTPPHLRKVLVHGEPVDPLTLCDDDTKLAHGWVVDEETGAVVPPGSPTGGDTAA